mgnify:CR=1 FL=1|jgi:hypothetical protein
MFEEALQFIKTQKKQDFTFEHAYTLHRMGRNREAIKVIGNKKVDLNLLAQINYKLGDYKSSVDNYMKVLASD